MNKDGTVDPKAFGRRVRECRLARGMSQPDLAGLTKQSQSNIDWIEKGRPKRPEKQVYVLAQALRTTQEWLLYENGPRDVGAPILSPQQFAESYALLPLADQQEFSELISKRLPQKPKSRKSA